MFPLQPSLLRFAPLAFALLLGACYAPVEYGYDERHPVQVQADTVAYPVIFGAGRDPFAGEAGQRLDMAITGFLEYGHGAIRLAASAPGRPDPARQAAELNLVREHLLRLGVPASVIRTGVGESVLPVDTITISYERYSASLPTCGDWSQPPSYNPTNQMHPNFGCAAQRNLGLMAADPADLEHARDGDGMDPQRQDDVITKYRAGAPTATQGSPHVSPQAQPNSAVSSVGH